MAYLERAFTQTARQRGGSFTTLASKYNETMPSLSSSEALEKFIRANQETEGKISPFVNRPGFNLPPGVYQDASTYSDRVAIDNYYEASLGDLTNLTGPTSYQLLRVELEYALCGPVYLDFDIPAIPNGATTSGNLFFTDAYQFVQQVAITLGDQKNVIVASGEQLFMLYHDLELASIGRDRDYQMGYTGSFSPWQFVNILGPDVVTSYNMNPLQRKANRFRIELPTYWSGPYSLGMNRFSDFQVRDGSSDKLSFQIVFNALNAVFRVDGAAAPSLPSSTANLPAIHVSLKFHNFPKSSVVVARIKEQQNSQMPMLMTYGLYGLPRKDYNLPASTSSVPITIELKDIIGSNKFLVVAVHDKARVDALANRDRWPIKAFTLQVGQETLAKVEDVAFWKRAQSRLRWGEALGSDCENSLVIALGMDGDMHNTTGRLSFENRSAILTLYLDNPYTTARTLKVDVLAVQHAVLVNTGEFALNAPDSVYENAGLDPETARKEGIAMYVDMGRGQEIIR